LGLKKEEGGDKSPKPFRKYSHPRNTLSRRNDGPQKASVKEKGKENKKARATKDYSPGRAAKEGMLGCIGQGDIPQHSETAPTDRNNQIFRTDLLKREGPRRRFEKANTMAEWRKGKEKM